MSFSYAFDFAGVVRWHLIPKRFALRQGNPGFRIVVAAALSKSVGEPA